MCGDGGNPGGGDGGTLSCGSHECGSAEMLDGKTWMTENLNKTTKDSWCYNNSADSCNKYGRLYTWDAAKKACPNGWHLSALDEWEHLFESVGGTKKVTIESTDWLDAAKKLKSSSGWNEYLGNISIGTDDYGFSALPGGSGYRDGAIVAGIIGTWWTATDMEADVNIAAYSPFMYSYNDVAAVALNPYDVGKSVRCVKN